ncbi:MAG: ribosome biogenesis GTPase YlqF [SAR324 cluster bacterium]|nr:ribosome biogenesis GTPase YlqF [SAR324 cluster bacterium]
MSDKPEPSNQERVPGVRAGAVSWFPGHMYKAQQRLAREIRNIDVVLEVRDARLPMGTANPQLDKLIGHRPRLLLLNKASLADPKLNKRWQAYFVERGVPALPLDADSRRGINLIFAPLRELCAPGAAKFRRRGMRPPLPRLMVVGMPNVGKSTFINRLLRQDRLATAPTPGVTRAVTWAHLKSGYLLMDTPGAMLPRIDDESAALRLGWIGALPDAAFPSERLGRTLLAYLLQGRFHPAARRYGLESLTIASPDAALRHIARRRGHLAAAGEPLLQRAAQAVLLDYRAGRLGRFTLEVPEDFESL